MEMAEQHPQAGIIFGKVAIVDPDGKELTELGLKQWPDSRFVTPERFLTEYLEAETPDSSLSMATIYRRKPLEEVGGFWEALGYWCDTFALRAIALKYGACYLAVRGAAMRCIPTSLGSSSRRDIKKSLDIVDRVAWLMRSPAFRDRFPEAYVAGWHRAIRRLLIEEQIARFLDAHHGYHAAYYSGILSRSLLNRVFGSLFSRTLNLHRRMAIASMRKSLVHYRGDLGPLLMETQATEVTSAAQTGPLAASYCHPD
jgi:hypothetical protein